MTHQLTGLEPGPGPHRTEPPPRQPTPTQHAFSRALLDPTAALPAGLAAWNGSDPGARFAVYRNNVVVSLVGALEDTFPVVRQLVGDEFFAAMARLHVCEQPPTSPVLTEYGDGFAEWIADFEPATALPYLADMARLERARVVACHAADAPSLGAQALAPHLANPARLADARLGLHPSLRVLVSAHAVVSLWSAHQAEGEMPVVEVDHAEAAIVLRDPGDEVLVLGVPLSTAAFVQAIQGGLALGEALASVPAPKPDDPDGPFDLGACLALLFRHGALVAWHQPGADE